jgi:hypothetical protein
MNDINDTQTDDFRFNTDLLLNEADRQRAQRLFPKVYFALYHKELCDEFKQRDPVANYAKRRSRVLGVRAVILVTFALLLAVGHPLYELYKWPEELVAAISGLSALCGLAGALIGTVGILHSGKKRDWLLNRLRTEKMRSFHFRTMLELSHLLLVGREDDYIQARANLFDKFHVVLEQPKLELDRIVRSEDSDTDATPVLPNLSDIAPDRDIEVQWREAYKALRIDHQIDYATYKLRNDASLFSKFPKRQVAVFAIVALLCVTGLIFTHVVVAGDVAYRFVAHAVAGAYTVADLQTPQSEAILPWMHVSGLWLAIVALALRTLQEGLDPGREVERYRHYRSAMLALKKRFNSAGNDVKKALEVATGCEHASTNEMCNFLRAGNEARFVM